MTQSNCPLYTLLMGYDDQNCNNQNFLSFPTSTVQLCETWLSFKGTNSRKLKIFDYTAVKRINVLVQKITTYLRVNYIPWQVIHLVDVDKVDFWELYLIK